MLAERDLQAEMAEADQLASTRLAEEERGFRGLSVGGGTYINEDPKRGNMVVIDMSLHQWEDGEKEVLLGDWETEFTVGYIFRRTVAGEYRKDPQLFIHAYEPYCKDPSGRLVPLWARNAAAPPGTALSTRWQDVLRLPWLPITRLPVPTWDRFYSDGRPLRSQQVVQNWEGTNIAVLPQLPRTHDAVDQDMLVSTHRASFAAAVFTLDERETEARRLKKQAHVHTFPPEEYTRLARLGDIQAARRAAAGSQGSIASEESQ